MICTFDRLLETLAGYFRLVLDGDAVFVYARDFVVRDVATRVGLHGFFNLDVLLLRLFFQDEVPVSCLRLPRE